MYPATMCSITLSAHLCPLSGHNILVAIEWYQKIYYCPAVRLIVRNFLHCCGLTFTLHMNF